MIGEQSLAWRLDLVADMDLPLPTRAIALFGKLSARWSGKEGAHDLLALASTFLNLGVPPDLLQAAREAAMLTREPIVAVAPLLWLAASQDPARSIVDCAVPDAPAIDGVPLYAFDKHTAIGKAAIHRLARESQAVRDALAAFVEDDRARDVAAMAAFYADARPSPDGSPGTDRRLWRLWGSRAICCAPARLWPASSRSFAFCARTSAISMRSGRGCFASGVWGLSRGVEVVYGPVNAFPSRLGKSDSPPRRYGPPIRFAISTLARFPSFRDWLRRAAP